MVNQSRRDFIAGIGMAGAALALPGCCCPVCGCGKNAKIALQLYSIKKYIADVGIAKAIEEVAKIGYRGVEICGYDMNTAKAYGKSAKELKAIFDANGVVMCGEHIARQHLTPDQIARTCEFSLECGSTTVINPGGGNIPPGAAWGVGQDGGSTVMNGKQIEFVKELVEFYNRASENAAKHGCRIGLHNHTWEFGLRFPDGRTFWDYFFSNTSRDVLMELDVGWATCAGFEPAKEFAKFPHRSPTLHAKENGMGPGVKKFDAILGKPGEPGAKPVDWAGVIAAAKQDGVEWFVVECERHFDDLSAVTPSYEFLKSKGLN